jgi:hypothetical protein
MKGEVMSKLRKLVLTAAALAALAVGGAAFANAQNAAVATQVPTHQSTVDLPEPGDTPDAARVAGHSGEHEDGGQAGASHDTETSD